MLATDLPADGGRSAFSARLLRAEDGAPLHVYEGGAADQPPLILINAYGLPCAIWEPFAAALAERYRIVTWESRDVPDLSHPFDESRCDVATHVADLELIMSELGIQRAALVGWCSGAQVALRLAALRPECVSSLVLLAGSFRSFVGLPCTQFRTMLDLLLRQCVGSRAKTEVYWRMLFGGGLSNVAPAARKGPSLNDAWAHVPESVQRMTRIPYSSAEALYRYAKTLTQVEAEPEHAWTEGITQPTLIVGGTSDAIVHPDSWREVFQRIRGARLVLKPDLDHYMLYSDPSLPMEIDRFLSEAQGLAAALTKMDARHANC